MKWKKFMIILILLIFTTGMIMGATSATHVFKDNGYKYKMSDKKLKYMKKNARKMGSTDYYAKVSKKVKVDSKEKVTKKIFKKAQKKGWSPYGEEYSFVSCKKISNGHYKVTLKKTATMYCWVGYSHGKYSYYADAY